MNFLEIDSARQRAGMTVLELSRRARVAPSTYWFIRTGKVTPRGDTLRRYAEALAPNPRIVGERDVSIVTAYRGVLAYIAGKLGLDPKDAVDRAKAREFWRARALAIDCVGLFWCPTQSDLARALGTSKQVISWNRKQSLEMRADPAIEAIVQEAGQVLSGEHE